MDSIIKPHIKVRMSEQGIGTPAWRLSDTDSGRAASMARHPAGKAILENMDTLTALLMPHLKTDEEIQAQIAENQRLVDEADPDNVTYMKEFIEARTMLRESRERAKAEAEVRRAEALKARGDSDS